jgi:hypothetical protein
MCFEKNCKKSPSFNLLGEKPLYCSEHRKENMVNVRHKICSEEGCKVVASFNIAGEKTPIYCVTHKKDNMINLKNKQCAEKSCMLRPYFNLSSEKKGLYCNEHKKDKMVDVVHKKCMNKDCIKRPIFNFEGMKQALFCAEHKDENMIDIQNPTCKNLDCKNQPNFNYPSEKKALYCSVHKLSNMIDIIHASCIEKDCNLRASYNFLNEKNFLYCNIHKKDGMVDIRHTTCKTHLCETRAGNKYDGYCLRCFSHIFPEKPIVKNFKTKEREVIQFIKQEFPDFTWTFDKKVSDGCSLYRPDAIVDLGYNIIIIEIDENQHKAYDEICENKRMMQISKDLQHRPIVFIRFNPDEYIKENQKISSCWGTNKKGDFGIKPTKKKEWNQRLTLLKETITFWKEESNVSSKMVEIISLFFDDDNYDSD